MTFWLCMGCLAAGGGAALAVIYLEYRPLIAHHEENERQVRDSYYSVKGELEEERKIRRQAQEEIKKLSSSVIEAERERQMVCKRLKGQFRENSKLKKAMRRRKKPAMRHGGRGKKRCMKALNP